MDDYLVLIPSFKRVQKQDTLDLIKGAYPSSRIIISTQTQEDYVSYNKKYKNYATIIHKTSDCVGGNRNTLLEYAQKKGYKKAIMLDDDIRGFLFKNNQKIDDSKSVKNLINKCMEIAKKNNALCFGAYPVCNTFFMKEDLSQNILIGTFFGIMNTNILFDPKFRVKEDFEYSLRIIQGGGIALRFNNFSPIAKHKTKGGCECEWKKKEYPIYAQMLVNRYPNLIKHSNKIGEVKFIKQ